MSKVIVVTGAGAGVGRATAVEFARRGDRVALLARGEEQLAAAAREVRAAGGTPLEVVVDVADAAAVEAAAERIERELGPIDIWVNNAMTAVLAFVHETSAEDFRRVTEVNYLGYVHGTLAALKRMRVRDRGTIVQVGSALAYRAIPLQATYCATKFAIRGFTDSLRTELLHEGSGVDVTMVQLPGLNTPQFTWVKTTLHRHPRPVAPVFQPEVAARAIVFAAEHPRRERWLGLNTAVIIAANHVVPGIADRYLARTNVDGQQTDEPIDPDRPDYLHAPLGDRGTLRRRGQVPRVVVAPGQAPPRPHRRARGGGGRSRGDRPRSAALTAGPGRLNTRFTHARLRLCGLRVGSAPARHGTCPAVKEEGAEGLLASGGPPAKRLLRVDDRPRSTPSPGRHVARPDDPRDVPDVVEARDVPRVELGEALADRDVGVGEDLMGAGARVPRRLPQPERPAEPLLGEPGGGEGQDDLRVGERADRARAPHRVRVRGRKVGRHRGDGPLHLRDELWRVMHPASHVRDDLGVRDSPGARHSRQAPGGRREPHHLSDRLIQRRALVPPLPEEVAQAPAQFVHESCGSHSCAVRLFEGLVDRIPLGRRVRRADLQHQRRAVEPRVLDRVLVAPSDLPDGGEHRRGEAFDLGSRVRHPTSLP